MLSRTWANRTWEQSVKRWEANRYSHSAIDAIVDICSAEDLQPDEIKSIHFVHGSYIHSLGAISEDGKRHPGITMQGKLSHYWLAGAVVVHRRVWLTEYEPKVFFPNLCKG